MIAALWLALTLTLVVLVAVELTRAFGSPVSEEADQ